MADEREITIRIAAKNLSSAEFDKARKEIAGIGKSADDTSSKGSGIAGSFKNALGILTTGATVAVGALAGLGAGVVALGSRGAEVADLQGSFETLNESIGNNADTLLKTLRQAMRGTVADAELFAATNQAIGQGLALNETQFDLTAKASRVLADRIGGDTTTAYKTLLDAMASGRDMTLKTVGLNIDAKAATEAYAASIGKTSGELTESEQIIAKKNAILAEMQRALELSGEAEVDFADRVDQAKVFLQNLTDQVAVGIANSPVLAAALGGVADALGAAFGSDTQTLAETVIGLIEDAAGVVIDLAQVGLFAADGIVKGFYGVRAVFFDALAAIMDVETGLKGLAASAFEVAAKTPGVGSAFKDTAREMRDAANVSGAMRDSLRGTAAEAHKAADGGNVFSRTIQTLQGGLADARDAMDKAREAQASQTKETDRGASALRNLAGPQGGHVALTKAQEKALQEAEKAAEKFRESVKPLGPTMTSVALGGGSTWIATNYALAGSLKDTATEIREAGGDMTDLASDTAIADRAFEELQPAIEDAAVALENEARLQEEAAATTREHEEMLGDLADAFVSLAQVSEGSFGTIAQWIGTVVNAMRLATQSGQQMMAGFSQIRAGGTENVVAGLGSMAGGIAGAIGSMDAATSSGSKLKDTLGGAAAGAKIGTAIFPGLGTAIGAVAGGMFGFARAAFSVSKEVKEARGHVAAFEDKLHDTLTATQRAEAGNERWAMTTIAVRDAYLAMGKSEDEAYAATERLWESSRRGPEASAAAIAEVNAVLEDQQALMAEVEESNFTWQELQQQAEEYGVDLAALGPQFASAKLNEKAASLITFLERARSAGADWGAVLMGTRDEIGELIGEARRMGIALPENMRPFIDDLFASGNLLDENGNKIEDISDLEFTEPLEIKVGNLVDEIRNLIQEMARIPRRVDTEVHRRYTESGDREGDGGGDSARNYDRGTKGVHGTYFPDFGAGGELVRVHNEEMILPRQDLPQFLRDMAPAASASPVNLYLVNDERGVREISEHQFAQIQARLRDGRLSVASRQITARAS